MLFDFYPWEIDIDIDGWGCVFKHPFLRFEEEEFRKWDCGYILGSILLMKDL